MNWKLINYLSFFGVVMAIGTTFFIPSTIEPICWLVIFIICAYIIAKQCTSNYFLHGLFVSMLNSVWITVFHILFFDTYIASHAEEAEMSKSFLPESPRITMLIIGPVIGVISGCVLGLFAFIASKLVKKSVTVS